MGYPDFRKAATNMVDLQCLPFGSALPSVAQPPKTTRLPAMAPAEGGEESRGSLRRFQYMWADAGISGFSRLAALNPARWMWVGPKLVRKLPGFHGYISDIIGHFRWLYYMLDYQRVVTNGCSYERSINTFSWDAALHWKIWKFP